MSMKQIVNDLMKEAANMDTRLTSCSHHTATCGV